MRSGLSSASRPVRTRPSVVATVVAWATDGAVEAEWAAGAGSLLGATTTTAGGGTGIGTSPVMVEVPVEQDSLLAGAG